MRTPITLRLDTAVLDAARAQARRDSRTLTNFVEVALRARLGWTGQDHAGPGADRAQAASGERRSLPRLPRRP